MKTAIEMFGFLVILMIGALLAFVVSFSVAYVILKFTAREDSERVISTVKAVCDYGRNTLNGESEEACGIAQDTAQAEYLCNSNGICWAEDKR